MCFVRRFHGRHRARLDAENLAQQLGAGNEVRLTGFGKFWVSHRPARKGRNPQTGEPIEIHARAVPKLSPGAGLKQAVQ